MRPAFKLTAVLGFAIALAACGSDGDGPDGDTSVDTTGDMAPDTLEDVHEEMMDDPLDEMPIDVMDVMDDMDDEMDMVDDMEPDDAGEEIVSITVTSVGMAAYDFTEIDPPELTDVIGSETENQTLTLTTGTRYEIVNLASTGHPFELLTLGGSPGEDVVLLSQSAAGSMESDTGVDWFDDGVQTVRFTLSTGLAAALSGYRCSLHASTMRGAITTM